MEGIVISFGKSIYIKRNGAFYAKLLLALRAQNTVYLSSCNKTVILRITEYLSKPHNSPTNNPTDNCFHFMSVLNIFGKRIPWVYLLFRWSQKKTLIIWCLYSKNYKFKQKMINYFDKCLKFTPNKYLFPIYHF